MTHHKKNIGVDSLLRVLRGNPFNDWWCWYSYAELFERLILLEWLNQLLHQMGSSIAWQDCSIVYELSTSCYWVEQKVVPDNLLSESNTRDLIVYNKSLRHSARQALSTNKTDVLIERHYLLTNAGTIFSKMFTKVHLSLIRCSKHSWFLPSSVLKRIILTLLKALYLFMEVHMLHHQRN